MNKSFLIAWNYSVSEKLCFSLFLIEADAVIFVLFVFLFSQKLLAKGGGCVKL